MQLRHERKDDDTSQENSTQLHPSGSPNHWKDIAKSSKMTSYGAIETQPSNAAQAASDAAASNLESNAGQIPSAHSFQEMDMRFLQEDKTSNRDRRRKLISTLVPIIIAIVIILLFAKVALGAIGPAHDPKYPSEFGSRPAATTTTTTAKSSKTIEQAPVAAPVSPASSSSSSSYKPDEDTKSSSSSSTSATASCSQNKACDKLGLTGLCCPTGEGVTLGCCN